MTTVSLKVPFSAKNNRLVGIIFGRGAGYSTGRRRGRAVCKRAASQSK